MTTTPAESRSDSLAPALRELLDVFQRELAEVQFPGVDHKVLRDLAAQVESEGQRVDALRQQLEEAQNILGDAQTKLVRAAELGLAYARVYAADDAALLDRLSTLHVGNEPAPKRRKLEVAATGEEGAVRLPAKRGRKPKVRPEGEETGEETGT
jgi:hypothetical protein